MGVSGSTPATSETQTHASGDAQAEAERQEAERQEAERLAIELQAELEQEEQARQARAQQEQQQARLHQFLELAMALPAKSDVPWPTRLPGKALVWHVRSNQASPVQERLPEDLRGTLDDQALVLFLVGDTSESFYQTLTADNPFFPDRPGPSVSAYATTVDIRIVDCANNQALGPFTIHGAKLPSSVSLQTNEFGSYVASGSEMDAFQVRLAGTSPEIVSGYGDQLASFVRGRFGEPGPIDQFLAASDSQTMTTLSNLNELGMVRLTYSAIPQLATKLRQTAGDARYPIIELLRKHSMRAVGPDPMNSFQMLFEPAMGPGSLSEFQSDADNWTEKWLAWCAQVK